MCVEDTLYALGEYSVACFCPRNPSLSHKANCAQHTSIIIYCYDPDNDMWTKKTKTPDRCMLSVDQTCSITVFSSSEFARKVHRQGGATFQQIRHDGLNPQMPRVE